MRELAGGEGPGRRSKRGVVGYLRVHSARARTTGGGLAAEKGGGVTSAPRWRRSGGVVMGQLGPGGSVGGEEASWGAKSGPCVGGTAVP